MEKKVAIIDLICEKRPSYGVKKGWSTYTGGMADTGYWFFRKMLDFPEDELQAFLDEINAIESRPVTSLTDEEVADSKELIDLGNGIWTKRSQIENSQQFNRYLERKLFTKTPNPEQPEQSPFFNQ